MNSGITEVMVNELDRLVFVAKASGFPYNLAIDGQIPIAIAHVKERTDKSEFYSGQLIISSSCLRMSGK